MTISPSDSAGVPDDRTRPAHGAETGDEARAVAEEQCVSGEMLRDAAEHERGLAEGHRENAEARRQDAERGRDHAEGAREAAEAARQAAEAAREETMALRAAFHEQLAIMREMQDTLRALEARVAQSDPLPPPPRNTRRR